MALGSFDLFRTWEIGGSRRELKRAQANEQKIRNIKIIWIYFVHRYVCFPTNAKIKEVTYA